MHLTASLILPSSTDHTRTDRVVQGYFLRRQNGLAYFYSRQAGVMTPIRRSVGGSEANYLKSSFEERAREVLAGVEMLKNRSDINPSQIGLYGDSQTAWIAPLASTFSPDVAFLILRVPSALPVTENILYELTICYEMTFRKPTACIQGSASTLPKHLRTQGKHSN